MAGSQVTQKQWILLAVLTLATLILWKVGAPQQPQAQTISGTTNTPGYTTLNEGKACCEKPPNRASLLQQSTPVVPTPTPTPVPETPR